MERMLAAILESGDPERLYTGLSLLVSAAVDGRPVRGFVGFGALGRAARARARGGAARDRGRARSVRARRSRELRDTAVELPDCRSVACAAAVQATGADWVAVGERFGGVSSMPQFLREIEGAELVFV